jgi:hypothetical protein
MIKERKGWTYNKSGFWVKNKGYKHSHNVPFFCLHCNKICGDVDEKYLKEYGFCWECHSLYVDARQTPTIDIQYYKNLKES